MATSTITYPLRVTAPDCTLMICQFTVGATGAVGTIKRTGFGASAISTIRGSVVRDSAGEYILTLPGAGAFQMIFPLGVQVESADNLIATIEAVDESAGTIQVQFWDAETAATETDPSNGDVVSIAVLVSDFPHLT